MRVEFWGVRGSVAVAGESVLRYGGNTSCVTVDSGEHLLVLDAGTGIRTLGQQLQDRRQIDVLLTHLHLDHIMGLLFFAPLFDPDAEVTIWGPRSAGAELRARLARYLSAPLSPVEIRDLPAKVTFRDCPTCEWEVGPLKVRAELVNHRGRTLGYRLASDGQTVAYLPDHEPALGARLDRDREEWISGWSLAREVDLLVHDGQYGTEQYQETIGYGHSCVGDAVAFASRCEARAVRLFHHDPGHDDDRVDALAAEAAAGFDGPLAAAAEGEVVEVGAL